MDNPPVRRAESAQRWNSPSRCNRIRVIQFSISPLGPDAVVVPTPAAILLPQKKFHSDQAAAQSAMHMVSAWANAHRLVVGQRKVAAKSNEITAIPPLLRM